MTTFWFRWNSLKYADKKEILCIFFSFSFFLLDIQRRLKYYIAQSMTINQNCHYTSFSKYIFQVIFFSLFPAIFFLFLFWIIFNFISLNKINLSISFFNYPHIFSVHYYYYCFIFVWYINLLFRLCVIYDIYVSYNEKKIYIPTLTRMISYSLSKSLN